MKIEIEKGRVFVDDKETVDPVLIGYAVLDLAESKNNEEIKIVFKEQDVFVESLITQF